MTTKHEPESPQERLMHLADCLNRADIKGAEESIQNLIIEAMKDNPEAIRQLIELSKLFSDINISFNTLADFIEKKFNC